MKHPVDILLTMYVDEINNGKNPDALTYCMLTPKEYRSELITLLNTVNIIIRNKEYLKLRRRPASGIA